MSDLLSVLSLAGRSLTTYRNAVNVANHNIQNALTPGYARQRAELHTVQPADFTGSAYIGRGVDLGGVFQIRDRFVEAQMPRAIASQARSSAESAALRAVNVLNPDTESGLSLSLAKFYSSLRELSGNAGDPILRQGVVDAARNLATSFNRTSVAIRDAREGMNEQIAAQLDQANAAAKAIAELNGQIASARSMGGEPNDLVDTRQALMDKLSELTGAMPVSDARGNVSMVLDSGAALVSGDKAAVLTTLQDVGNSGHFKVMLIKPDGRGPFDLPVGAVGGKVGGILDARDGALRTAEESLDQFAWEFGQTLNGVHRGGVALDGNSGRDLFTLGAGAPGAAATIRIDGALEADPSLLGASSDALGLPGNGDVLFALIETEKANLPSGSDPIRTLGKIVGAFGSRTAQAEALAKTDASVLGNLEDMRESASGVSVDEELLEMMKYQRAFEAVSKVIQTTDQMLDTLMKLR